MLKVERYQPPKIQSSRLHVAVPEIMYDKFRGAPPLLTNGSAALKAFRLRKMNIILLFYSIKYYFILFHFIFCNLYPLYYTVQKQIFFLIE